MPKIELVVVDDLPPKKQEEWILNGSLEEWLVTVRYFCKTGVLQVPKATNDDTAACLLVKMHGATWQKVVEYSIKRSISPPIAPDFETDDTNEVLLDYDFKVSNPIPWDTERQGFLIQRWGHYRYALKTPPEDPHIVNMPIHVYYPDISKGTIQPEHWTKKVFDF